MLAVFRNGVVDPPKELHSVASSKAVGKDKTPDETLKDCLASDPNNSFSLDFVNKVIMAYVPPRPLGMPHQRLFCSVDDVHCMFLGNLNNLCNLNKQYGLSKGGNEAMSDTVFIALGADKAVNLFWGVAADGSVMISDDVSLVKASCRKSFAPFPAVDAYSKVNSMPRVGSEANWATWG
ncbi:hypothetical protein Sango_1382500 [Sesamum angolense]|uniref:DUF3700 domain-containing protein n=1 Tax=Sesamum angolense TaxID=2727404 RepID=A0AAE1WT37_9LAMI|nr:hypothetical protein Sango_1382500 [Sesamum angolense]